MDAATQNVFAPVQVFPHGTTLQPVTVEGAANVFFGARFALPSTGQTFKTDRNTYVGVSGVDTPHVGADRFQRTGQVASVLISNNYQLPPVGVSNVVVGNDICCDFVKGGNTLIAPFTPRSITGTNVPVVYDKAFSVFIGYPDPSLCTNAPDQSIVINSATPLPSGQVQSVGNVVFNVVTLTTAQESDFNKAGVPVGGLYFNSETNELRIRLQ